MPLLSYAEIARLEERRQALGTAEVVQIAEPIGGGFMAFEGPGSWANQACALGLDGPVPADEIDRLVAFYTSRGVEPKIEVCPFAHESLVRGLAERGFTLREFENVLARELGPEEDLRAVLSHGWPPDLLLLRVDPADEEQVRVFIDVSTHGFRREGEPIFSEFLAVTRRVVAHPRCDSFLALVGGEPAGGGGMETAAGVSCLFGASVLPRFRRRGIQQALIVRRLERARERGCRLACIHSRPGIPTERNAARLGFFMAYTKAVMALRGEGLLVSP